MSDDLGKKIKQITDVLSQDGMPDNLKGLLSMLANSASKEEETSNPTEASPPREEKSSPREDRSMGSELEENLEMMRKVKKIMDLTKANAHDPRINLLNALKPFVSGKRQKKVSNCIQMLQLSSLTGFLNDKEKGSGF